ncbi:hypothetical protein DL93DRAFT_1697824 [Clavulina sp. PMI_390]|nr:hypothetical protein DL93DRAFT_1697824 [Clavulina sp. PMI_390]
MSISHHFFSCHPALWLGTPRPNIKAPIELDLIEFQPPPSSRLSHASTRGLDRNSHVPHMFVLSDNAPRPSEARITQSDVYQLRHDSIINAITHRQPPLCCNDESLKVRIDLGGKDRAKKERRNIANSASISHQPPNLRRAIRPSTRRGRKNEGKKEGEKKA